MHWKNIITEKVTNMKFSIIIPAYNAENHIKKALDSIRIQTFTDYEIIVVCDSCEDSTEAIANSYNARVYNVKFHRDGLTRNKGLDVANGDWILFMDDDDWFLHEFVLQQISDKLDENPLCDVLCFSFIWKGVIYAKPNSNMGTLFPSVWNKCWRKSFIGETRFTDVYSISDFYFHKEMMQKHPRIILWDMPLYYYNYLRKGSISDEMGRTYEQTRKYWERN